MAQRRHSMNLSSSPLALSAFSGEYTRDFDALCLLYPFVPSSVSQNAITSPEQQLFTPTKVLATPGQPAFISSPSAPINTTPYPISQPLPIPSSHQIPQSRPQSAPNTTRQSARQLAVAQPSLSSQPISQPTSISPKHTVPKLALASSPDRKERYSNRERSHASTNATTQPPTHASASANATPTTATPTSASGAKTPGRTPTKSGATKSMGARRDAGAGAASVSKRKVKLEGSFSMGKRPNSTITHSNTTPELLQDITQVPSSPSLPPFFLISFFLCSYFSSRPSQ